MKNRVVRVALVVLAAVSLAVAGLFVYRTELQLSQSRESLRALDRDVTRILANLSDLRGAQAGLVGAGQDISAWTAKANRLTADTSAALQAIDRTRLVPEVTQQLTAATDALVQSEKASSHIRDLLATDQPLTASGVVFNDATQVLVTAATAVGNANLLQATAFDRDSLQMRLLEAYAVGGVGVFLLIVVLMLLPTVVERAADQTAMSTDESVTGLGLSRGSSSSAGADSAGQSGLDLNLTSGRTTSARMGQEIGGKSEAPRPPAEPEPRKPSVDLGGTAALCADMACIQDATELRALLTRAATLLDASGIVVWIGGVGAAELRPTFSFGYSDNTIARMKSLPADDSNAVSQAFRTGRLELVGAAGGRNGAIVTPVNTSSGCVGAMAAEIRHGGESNPDVQAVATIISAQLATLISSN